MAKKTFSLSARCWALFLLFFGISAVTLGGGLTMLPVMQREFVEKRHWLTEEDMVDTVAVMQSLPGVIACNMSVLLGYRIAGVPGALTATIGVVLPPFLVILAVALGLRQLAASETLNHIFLGIRAGVTALILLSAIKLGRQIIKDAFTATIAVIAFVALAFLDMNAVWFIVAAAIAGLLWNWVRGIRAAKGEA
ncbi:MAG: chromate transporter [Victivallales bacterium]|nr:chromate transporter [Victivallales bacterium]